MYQFLLAALAAVITMAGCAKHNPASPEPFDAPAPLQGEENADYRLAKPITGTAVVRARIMVDGATATNMELHFSRAISGRRADYAWNAEIGVSGWAELQLPAPGYFQAKATGVGEDFAVGEWGSIPINPNKEYTLLLTIGGGYTMESAAIQPAIIIARNSAMADANAANPTAVVGGRGAKVMSITVINDSREDRYLDQILAGTVFPQVFQNLKLYYGTTQMGITVGTLSAAAADIQFGHSILMPAGTQVVLDLYADIKSSASAEDIRAINESPDGPFAVISASATGATSGHMQVYGVTKGQKLYLVPHGDLRITLSPDNHPSVLGGTPVLLAAGGEYSITYRFEAGAAEDVSLPLITPVLYTPDEQSAYVDEMRLYNEANLIGTYHPGATPSGLTARNQKIPFHLESGALTIAANTYREVTIWFRVSRDCPISTGITILLTPEVIGQELIQARGMASGQLLPLQNVFSPAGQPSLWVAGRVVAGPDEQQLFPAIAVRDFSITHSAEVEGFEQMVQDGIWTVDVEFAPGILSSSIVSVRLVFASADAGIVTMLASEIVGNRVRFQKPWVGHREEVLLASEGTEVGFFYGDLAFFAR